MKAQQPASLAELEAERDQLEARLVTLRGEILRARVLAFVRSNPGRSTRRVVEAVRGEGGRIAVALVQLEAAGLLAWRPNRMAKAWTVTEALRQEGAGTEPFRAGEAVAGCPNVEARWNKATRRTAAR